jgi:putative transposase
MAGRAPEITPSELQLKILKTIERAHKTSQQLAGRVKIILLAAAEETNLDIAAKLDVDAQRVGRWRRRWADTQVRLDAAETNVMMHEEELQAMPESREAQQAVAAARGDLEGLILETLSDNYRSGTPPKFTAEQVTMMIAVACENPEDSGYPVTHWTPKELAAEVIRRGIVESISIRHLDRFLKGDESQAA